MGIYKKIPYAVGQDTSVLQPNRRNDKVVGKRANLPGTIIVSHGVNDVGVGYGEVEKGLCTGLAKRLNSSFTPGTYRLPNILADGSVDPHHTDSKTLMDDPDDIFFKRKFDGNTHSPVIPFYWGFREVSNKAQISNGQIVDRHGNRLDKDRSKEGGPFANATGTLPDMWNYGVGAPLDPVGDPIRPVKNAPGRMYMVLAAKRLAALVAMIRDYDENEVVSIVAHSQGTMLSLLAQAFLMDWGLRPADTLVLIDSPYSLEQKTTLKMFVTELVSGDSNVGMTKEDYKQIADRQTFAARLDTLVNIVHGVAEKRHTVPAFTELKDAGKHCGMVGAKWQSENDRDNRGKVYVYFSPEDMTVALDHLHGIGWQGIPDCLASDTDAIATSGWSYPMDRLTKKMGSPPQTAFYQRVFTNRHRLDLVTKKLGPVKVGQPPHDYALHLKGEDDHAHVAEANRSSRGTFPTQDWPVKEKDDWLLWSTQRSREKMRDGIRTINGEALPEAIVPRLNNGQIEPKDIPKNSQQAGLPANEAGPCEEVDPIDAAIAISTDKGLKTWREECPDPSGRRRYPGSPTQLPLPEQRKVAEQYNIDKKLAHLDPLEHRKVLQSFLYPDGKVIAQVQESPNEARRRWQNEVSPKSFHSAIFACAYHHEKVTAYDVAIGGGKAVSDPKFYAYLCAVADWRMKQGLSSRPSIMKWDKFLEKVGKDYWCDEPQWRKDIIEGNAVYYSTGQLPACIEPLRRGLPTAVVCETIGGKPMQHAKPRPVGNTPPASCAMEGNK